MCPRFLRNFGAEWHHERGEDKSFPLFLFRNMPHFVYIIYSENSDRFYVGETLNVQRRIEQHNAGHYNHASTKFANDWKLFLKIECHNRTQALKMERFIKKMKSRKFYFQLKENSTLIKNLFDRFKS